MTHYTDDELTDQFHHTLFPNVTLTGTPEGLHVFRTEPDADDPNWSTFDYWYLAPEIEGIPFNGGLVGTTGYDVVRFFERLPPSKRELKGLPEGVYVAPESLLVFERRLPGRRHGEAVTAAAGARPPTTSRSCVTACP